MSSFAIVMEVWFLYRQIIAAFIFSRKLLSLYHSLIVSLWEHMKCQMRTCIKISFYGWTFRRQLMALDGMRMTRGVQMEWTSGGSSHQQSHATASIAAQCAAVDTAARKQIKQGLTWANASMRGIDWGDWELDPKQKTVAPSKKILKWLLIPHCLENQWELKDTTQKIFLKGQGALWF